VRYLSKTSSFLQSIWETILRQLSAAPRRISQTCYAEVVAMKDWA